jgi:hypothetical protein
MRSLALPYWSAVKPVPPSTVGQSQAIVWPWCGVSRNDTTGVFASKHVRSLSVIDCYFIRYYFTGTDLLL